MNRLLTIIISTMLALSATAQRERNYVYIIDCTQSMRDDNHIWEETKKYLKDDIQRQADNSTINVVPFQSTAHAPMSFVKKDMDWKAVDKKLEEYIQNRTNTGICKAWDRGVSLLDATKDNYLFLLTDGNDNVDGMSAVCQRISGWCQKYKNSYAFYVMLCEAANNKQLEQAIGDCDRFSLIDANGHPQPIGSFYPHEITINTRDIQPKQIVFSDAGEYPIKIECDDPLFDVATTGAFKNGQTVLTVKPKKDLKSIRQTLDGKEIYSFEARLIPEGNINVPNKNIIIDVINKPVRGLSIISEEPNFGKATYYDKFLFWGASDVDTLFVDLKAAMNKEAIANKAQVRMRCNLVKGDVGFKLLYNGEECANNSFVIRHDDKQSIFGIVFDTDAPEGKRNFEITADNTQSLDVINDESCGDFLLTARASYSKSWNPLQTILLWLCLIALALLILWFAVARPVAYATFKAKKLTILGPISKSVILIGCRRVVFTSKPKKQSLLNRIFTRRVEYVIGEYWTDEFEIAPTGEMARLEKTKGKYFTDNGLTILKNEETKIENSETNAVTTVLIS